MTSRAVWLAPLALVGLALPPAHQPAAGGNPPATVSPERAQFLARLGADRWQAAGARGRGVTVLIVDSGFRGWHSYLGGVLPAAVLTKSFRADASFETRDSCHGVLCGEIIHALAPDAELLFANWESDDANSFVRAVEWGKQHGARVMSCSVIMPCWSDGEGGGPIHAALTRVMGTGTAPGDMFGVAFAGNTAQRHWSGPFRRGAEGCHEWAPGQTLNAVTPWGEDRVSVELCYPPGAGYAIQVVNTVTGTEIGRATADPGGYCAVVRFVPTSGTHYAVRVWPGTAPAGPFHLSVLSGWLERCSPRGSIPFPADGPEFAAVGAVDADGRRVAYSSCGPNGVLPKPDFVAEVPVWTAMKASPFSGTSAAAPQAAGLAALVLSRHLDWSPTRVRAKLRQSAVDIAPPGHDPETGYGRLRLNFNQ